MRLSIIDLTTELAEQLKPKSLTPQKYCSSLPLGSTRNCLDPWTQLFVTATGGVRPCCNAPKFGEVFDRPLFAWMNSPEIKEYRRGLLSGSLMPACENCHDRPTISIDELRAKVSAVVAGTAPITTPQPS